MTLKIPLGPTTEAKLRRRAAAAGKNPEDFALEVIEDNLSSSDGSADQDTPLPPNQRVTELLKWVASHDPAGHPVDDSRESIYQGRGE